MAHRISLIVGVAATFVHGLCGTEGITSDTSSASWRTDGGIVKSGALSESDSGIQKRGAEKYEAKENFNAAGTPSEEFAFSQIISASYSPIFCGIPSVEIFSVSACRAQCARPSYCRVEFDGIVSVSSRISRCRPIRAPSI